MQENRDLSFDAFRGAAIIAVVALHVIRLSGYWGPRCIFYCQLFDFGVPAFLFISGYWTAKKPISSLQDYKTYLIRRLTRVLIPYLFWSFVLIVHDVIKTGDINVQQIIFVLLTGKASFPYFFIILIIQFYAMTPILHYINRKPYGLMLVLIVNVIGLLFHYLSTLYLDFQFPSVWLFCSWIIFYEIGLLSGKNDNSLLAEKKIRYFILPAIVVSLLASKLEGTALLSKSADLNFATHALKYSTFIYSACIIFGFLFLRESFHRWPKLLVLLGYYSFGIYLIHVPVIICVVRILRKTPIYPFPLLYQFVVGLIAMSICLALINTTRMLLPKTFCRKVFGF